MRCRASAGSVDAVVAAADQVVAQVAKAAAAVEAIAPNVLQRMMNNSAASVRVRRHSIDHTVNLSAPALI